MKKALTPVIVALLLCTACGQTGPLMLPSEMSKADKAEGGNQGDASKEDNDNTRVNKKT